MFSVLLKWTIYQLKIFRDFWEISVILNLNSTNIDSYTRAWTEQYSTPFFYFFKGTDVSNPFVKVMMLVVSFLEKHFKSFW